MTTITADNPFPSLKPNGLNADWNCRGWRLMRHVQILDTEDGFFMIAIVVETHDGDNDPLVKIYNANPELYEAMPENDILFVQTFKDLPLERVYEIVNTAHSLEWLCGNEPNHDMYIEDVIVANAMACITETEMLQTRGLHRFSLDGSPDFIGELTGRWNGWGVPRFDNASMNEFRTWVAEYILTANEESVEEMDKYLKNCMPTEDGKGWNHPSCFCWYVDADQCDFPII